MFIEASAEYIPERIVDNDYFSRLTGREPGWFEQRTGIRARRRGAPGENTNSMAVAAVRRLGSEGERMLADIDLIELNEAFASQSLAVVKELGIDRSKLNVNGGAIAVGHPLGSSGARLSVQLFNELRRQKKKYGMVTACVGGGQGVAGIYELL